MEEQFRRNHLVTTAGVVRCRFELFIHWSAEAGRQHERFTQRGDKYEKEDAAKMFRFLLQFFINKHHLWVLCELYDNTFPLEDPRHLILELKNKNTCTDRGEGWKTIDLRNKNVRHRLHDYTEMLKGFALPEWLKNNR